jgi:predicted Zn-dependent protease|tara:strand:+ start:436 stop:1329 length:894 start_codon:yes stop_codon:yes gene_type:complete
MGNIPCYDDIMARGETLTSELLDIIKAPLEKNDTLPVILDGENTGVVFHEVIGHSLEAHRMQEDEWGDVTTLFKDKIGEKVAPEFITLYDDPTRQELDGHYQFDEDGVRSQKVMLVENCVLKNYLHSRESAGYFKTRSNGHARAYGSHTPTPRMSNLFVESNNRVSFDELVESLRKECVDQKKPYGLLMEGTNGGLTLPEECFFNTFPSNVFRVYANGKTERVRGAYIVGTPLQVLNNFIQTSDRYSTFSGNCGAESGWIPSVEIAPDALVKSLEINRIPMSSYYKMPKPVLPKPDY